MSSIDRIPEIQSLDSRQDLIRIPPEQDIPLTKRVRRLIDAAEFRRLTEIRQLGLVGLVYPSANHTRFEHSLGVYRMALLYLRRLACDQRFRDAVSQRDAETFIVASLLHDIGHWPLCHAIEDMQLPSVPRHEQFAEEYFHTGEIDGALKEDWGFDSEDVASLISRPPRTVAQRILQSMLSGPIDVDKMDYLARDSLHAGVPYGRNFDQQRLIGALCLNEQGDKIAINEKGKTAAEMMVFARYVMFSEVYWHHAVRSATAMFQRAFFELCDKLELGEFFRRRETDMIEDLKRIAAHGPALQLVEGVFGGRRRLYKRLAQFSYFENPECYRQLARRPYPWLVECSEQFSKRLSKQLRQPIVSQEILIDAPPVELEVQFSIDVFFPKQDRYLALGEVSPVVRTLAQQQFDDYVKRVRVFVCPQRVEEVARVRDWRRLLDESMASIG